MKRVKEKIKSFRMPHTYVILTFVLLTVVALTYIIPAGEYLRVFDPISERMVVDPDSFSYIQGKQPNLFDIFLAVQRGYVSAANILFLIVFAYAYVYILTKNGTLGNAIALLIRYMGRHTGLLIPVFMLMFGFMGATLGIFEEVYGLVSVFIGIAVGLGYDVVVGGAIVYVGVATGFAAALTNPFSVGIAQSIAEVPLNSGLGYRVVVFILFELVSIGYVIWYARRVKADPTKSIMYGEQTITPTHTQEDQSEFTKRHVLCLLLFICTLGILVYGTSSLGWYINELAAMFLMMAVITAVIGGYNATQTCQSFIEATRNIVPSILVIGFTRGILITMQEARISDTIVHALANLLRTENKVLAAIGMLMLQNVINFFITGSSSQATITMPIMAPVADIVGISRQTAVLAYCFGDGFSDMFWPTACALECGLMGVPLQKWYKFMAPLFVMMLLLQIILIAVSVYIY